MSFPDYSEFNDVMNNIKATSDFAQFSVSETNIYQTLWPTNQSESGQALAAIILKGGLEVQIIGTSKSYKYDRVRESLFLTRIAERLPLIKSERTPCALITVDELWTIRPDPPAPNNELNTDEGYPVSVCKFIDDTMEFTISMATNPDLVRRLTEDMEQGMSTTDLLTHFSASDANIYQLGGRLDESKAGDVFHAVILKENISVQITGSGSSYLYDPEREALLLEAIAGRLP
jgi:hypothetical protein